MSDPGTGKKPRLLILRQLLLELTDEEHSLSTYEILSLLEERGISGERKTVYDDIEIINKACDDIEIDSSRKGKANGYHVTERLFTIEELNLLADAVASSRFITAKKSNTILEKLGKLASRYDREKLSRNSFVTNRVKNSNETIYYAVDCIQRGITDKKKITFKYYEYGPDKRLRPRHNGELYTVSPYRMTWEQDYYYLVCWCDKHNKFVNYRIDRMQNVTMTDEPIKPLEIRQDELVKRMNSAFGMYNGEEEHITLSVHNSILSSVIDKFGTNIRIEESELTGYYDCFVTVQISPPFWGWLFQFGNKARVVSPSFVVNQARNEIARLEKMYD